jgi:hypothetical protein
VKILAPLYRPNENNLFLYFSITDYLFSQINSKQEIPKEDFGAKLAALARDTAKVATMDQYRFISIERDTTYLDTAFTIQREYSFNYLRKDNFGLWLRQ